MRLRHIKGLGWIDPGAVQWVGEIRRGQGPQGQYTDFHYRLLGGAELRCFEVHPDRTERIHSELLAITSDTECPHGFSGVRCDDCYGIGLLREVRG